MDARAEYRGFGWWRVTPDGRLLSEQALRWTPGWTEATTCGVYPRTIPWRWRRLHPAGVPGDFCRCGLRGSFAPQAAGTDPRQLPGRYSGVDGAVFGVVDGAGPAVRDIHGWRARRARPAALYVAADRLLRDGRFGRAAGRYGVPLLRDFESLLATWSPLPDLRTPTGEPIAQSL